MRRASRRLAVAACMLILTVVGLMHLLPEHRAQPPMHADSNVQRRRGSDAQTTEPVDYVVIDLAIHQALE